jgi:hypothetical protein
VYSKSKVAIPVCLTRMIPKSATKTAVPSKDSVRARWTGCESVIPVSTTRTSRSSSTTTVMCTTPTSLSWLLLTDQALRSIAETVISVIILWRVALVSIEWLAQAYTLDHHLCLTSTLSRHFGYRDHLEGSGVHECCDVCYPRIRGLYR